MSARILYGTRIVQEFPDLVIHLVRNRLFVHNNFFAHFFFSYLIILPFNPLDRKRSNRLFFKFGERFALLESRLQCS